MAVDFPSLSRVDIVRFLVARKGDYVLAKEMIQKERWWGDGDDNNDDNNYDNNDDNNDNYDNYDNYVNNDNDSNDMIKNKAEL